MIGTITTGKSFYHCLSYCLEDKQNLTEEQKIFLSQKTGLHHKGRAEVLDYNLCFGNKNELTEQFRDVRKLSKRVEKPVLHLSLRLSPGETLSREKFMEIGKLLANEFELTDRQYITILHKDTTEPHIHLVANRVGTNGKALSTSNNYLKMDGLCRRLEKEYRLKEVLSARRFLPKEQRSIPRHDKRKEKLRLDIRQTLENVNNYHGFQAKMKSLGYEILKGRGISFIDDKKVKVKGSEVGYSLATIERIFELKQYLILQQANKIFNENQLKSEKYLNSTSQTRKPSYPIKKNDSLAGLPIPNIQQELSNLIYQLMKSEDAPVNQNQEIIHEEKRQRKKYKIRYQ
jgi:Relaxase/Mobilisation nuclease domain